MKLTIHRLSLLLVCAIFTVGFVANSKEVAKKTTGIQPPQITLQSSPEFTLANRTYLNLTFKVKNPNKEPLTYTGYAPNSFAPSIPVDRIAPLSEYQIFKDDKWISQSVGYCGTGLTDLPLHPGKVVTFEIAVPKDDWRLVKVEFGQRAGWTAGIKTSTMWGVILLRDEKGKITIP